MARNYTSTSAALVRYFMLHALLPTPRTCPMNPDDHIKATKTSTDNEMQMEKCDLEAALRDADCGPATTSWWALYFSYAHPELPVDGPYRGRNKTDLMLKTTRVSLSGREYVRMVAAAQRRLDAQLQGRGWLPARRRRLMTARTGGSSSSRG